ncbi:RNA polymerase sigma factor [Alteromonadaceae bacterium BrNp21-10]|nr:RNA polymerase sigma factor [Alteromonadaceae bacterium BrNp21-10]
MSRFLPNTNAVKHLLRRFVSRDDIDDIVQETFIRSYEADLKSEIKYVRSYMLQTAKHLALNHLAKWDNKYNDSLEDFAFPPVELNTQSFESQFASKERFLLFCKATEQLDGNVRKAFILKKVYGLTQKEIADYLQLSQSTVEKHVAKGLLQSAQYMQKIEHQHAKINTHAQHSAKKR